MLLLSLNWIRVVAFASGIFAASFYAMPASAAQIDESQRERIGFDSMAIDPAPTPAANINPNRSGPIATDGIGQNSSAVIELDAEIGKTLTDPNAIEWTTISPSTAADLPEKGLAEGKVADPAVLNSPAAVDNSQQRLRLTPHDPSQVQLELEVAPDEFANANRFNAQNSYRSRNYAIIRSRRPPRRFFGWLKTRRAWANVDPYDLWSDYNPYRPGDYTTNDGWDDSMAGPFDERFYAPRPRETFNDIAAFGLDIQPAVAVNAGSRELNTGDNRPIRSESEVGDLFDAIQNSRELPRMTDLPVAKSSFKTDKSTTLTQQVAANPAIVVHPPLVQPYRKNQYTFVVENRGSDDIRNLRVQFAVSEPASIFAALPTNALTTDRAALFQIEIIPAESHVELHLGAVSTDERPIEFISSVSVTSIDHFSVANSNAANFKQVGAIIGNEFFNSAENESRASTRELSVVLPGGSQVVRNPYFDNKFTDDDKTAALSSPFANQATIINATQYRSASPVVSQPNFGSNSSVVLNFSDN